MKSIAPSAISPSDEIADAELRVRVDSRPCPNITPSVLLLLWGDVLFLRANERPYFIALQAANAHPANVAVMVRSADTSGVY
jgi:hypothetical protein